MIRGLSHRDILRRAGNPAQLYGVRRVTVEDGRARGMSLYEVNTGGGLSVDVMPDNGLDLGLLSYRGVNISYLSKNGYTAAAAFNSFENTFHSTYPGGMLYTCGLLNVGPGNRDGEAWHPTHGRIHSIGAENRSAYVDEAAGEIVISGSMRESALFGVNLLLERRIALPIGQSRLVIEDCLTNQTPEPVETMILYHMNFGYPFLSEALALALPEGTQTSPRTEYAAAGLSEAYRFTAPVDGGQEQVYFHKIPSKEGMASLRAVNRALGVGAKLSYSAETLPILVQWKSMGSGDYALGLEPTNTYIAGRSEERAARGLPVVGGFGQLRMRVELEMYDL